MPYVLQRRNWERHGSACMRQPGFVRVQTFADYASAVAAQARFEAAERAQSNPFACGPPYLFHQTRLTTDVLADWVTDAGLEPPAPDADGHRDWEAWYATNQRRMTANQQHAIWDSCDRVRFYDLHEVAQVRSAYVLVRCYITPAEVEDVQQHWNAGPERDALFAQLRGNGVPLEVHLSRRRAEQARLSMEQMLREEQPPPFVWFNNVTDATSLPADEFFRQVQRLGIRPPGFGQDVQDWWDVRVSNHRKVDRVYDLLDKLRFYRLYEVEYSLERALPVYDGEDVHVVLSQALEWDKTQRDYQLIVPSINYGLPLRVYADRNEANQYALAQDQQCQAELMNGFWDSEHYGLSDILKLGNTNEFWRNELSQRAIKNLQIQITELRQLNQIPTQQEIPTYWQRLLATLTPDQRSTLNQLINVPYHRIATVPVYL